MVSIPNFALNQSEFDLLGKTVTEIVSKDVKSIDVIGKDEIARTFAVNVADGSTILARIANSNVPAIIIESEVATIKYVSENTSIPTQNILSYSVDPGHPLGPHILFEKLPGVKLESIWQNLPSESQAAIVARLAKYLSELSRHTFSAIGSLLLLLSASEPSDLSTSLSGSSSSISPPRIGPLTHPSFHIDGRASLSLDRGPFPTARAYFVACAQRELDCVRALFTQAASPEYQRELEDSQLQVERSSGLLCDLVRRCPGLDEDDKDLAPFSLDLHEISPKNILVSEEDPSEIVSITDWQCRTIRPLWRCARLPLWLSSSIPGEEDRAKAKLADIFRQTIVDAAGADSAFVRALDSDDTRHALDEVAEYNAFTDGFLVLPALQSILATIPGEEDVAGLQKLLDPKTLPGRAARISLMTQGSNSLFLAMSPPTSPIIDRTLIDFPGHRRPFRYSLPSQSR